MALPIAQLGYMPSINAPSHVPTYSKGPSMWEQLAAGILTNLATQVVGNMLEKDYTNAARQEGLVPNGEGQGPQAAPWWKKALTGPTMDRMQYKEAADAMRQRDQTRAAQRFTAEEGEKTRQHLTNLEQLRILNENSRFDRTLEMQGRELDARLRGQDMNTMLQGGYLEVARQNANTAANPPTRPIDVNRIVGDMATDIYKIRMEQWQQAQLIDPQNVPPQPTVESAVQEAAQAAARFLNISQPEPTVAPAIPLVDPATLRFGQ